MSKQLNYEHIDLNDPSYLKAIERYEKKQQQEIERAEKQAQKEAERKASEAERQFREARKLEKRGELETAREIYSKLADEKYPDALFKMFIFHLAKSRNNDSERNKALSCLKEAANAGVPIAQLILGKWYLTGASGVPKDFTHARRLLQQAADQGVGEAYAQLGIMFMEGQGVPENERAAVQYWEKGHDIGDIESTAYLGVWHAIQACDDESHHDTALKYLLRAKEFGINTTIYFSSIEEAFTVNDTTIFLLIGQTYATKKKYNPSLKYLKKAKESLPDDAHPDDIEFINEAIKKVKDAKAFDLFITFAFFILAILILGFLGL